MGRDFCFIERALAAQNAVPGNVVFSCPPQFYTLLAQAESPRRARSLLELSFESEEVREICEKRAIASGAIGTLASLALTTALADIDASEDMTEVRSLFGERLSEKTADQLSIRLGGGWSFVFRAGGANPPKRSTGTTDWEQVDRLRIMAFEKSYE